MSFGWPASASGRGVGAYRVTPYPSPRPSSGAGEGENRVRGEPPRQPLFSGLRYCLVRRRAIQC